MKTYILKRDCENDETFPRGTIVRVNDVDWEFEVMKGKLKGKCGHIADGLAGWLVENTEKNRRIFAQVKKNEKNLLRALKVNNSTITALKTVSKKLL